jgi:hypothetical protein
MAELEADRTLMIDMARRQRPFDFYSRQKTDKTERQLTDKTK